MTVLFIVTMLLGFGILLVLMCQLFNINGMGRCGLSKCERCDLHYGKRK